MSAEPSSSQTEPVESTASSASEDQHQLKDEKKQKVAAAVSTNAVATATTTIAPGSPKKTMAPVSPRKTVKEAVVENGGAVPAATAESLMDVDASATEEKIAKIESCGLVGDVNAVEAPKADAADEAAMSVVPSSSSDVAPAFSSDSDEMAPSSIVWAKVKGFAWWPGQILEENHVPGNVLRVKPTSFKTLAVFFWGTYEYAWCATDMLRPFEEHYEELSKKNKKPAFVKGLKEARDPATRQKILQKMVIGKIEANPDLEDAEAYEDEDDKAYSHKKKSSRRKSNPVSKKRSEEFVEDEEETDAGDKAAKARVSKKRRASEPPADLKSKRSKKESAEEEDDREDDNGEDGKEESNKDKDTKSPLEKLKRLRSKLQRFLQTDHTEPDHFVKADRSMSEVESFEIDLDLLITTKIGKVVRKISKMELPVDTYNLLSRSNAVMEKWKGVFSEQSSL